MDTSTLNYQVNDGEIVKQEMLSSGVADPAPWLLHTFGSSESDSGVRVGYMEALQHPAVWQAVMTIAGDLATLPIDVFRDGETEDKRDRTHPAWTLLNEDANPEMTAVDAREFMQMNTLLTGNGLAVIDFDGPRPVGLIPVSPYCWQLHRDQQSGQKYYSITVDDPHPTTRTFFEHEIFHIKNLSNGHTGFNTIGLAQNSLGTALAVNKFVGRSFRNQVRPSGVIESEKPIAPEIREQLREQWQDMHAGADNAAKIAILTESMKWKAMSVTPHEAEATQSQRLQREFIANIMGCPPHKVGVLENSSVRANLESQGLDYLNSVIRRYAVKWESECRRKFLSRRQKLRRTHYFKFDFKELLRPDTKTRYEAYKLGREMGALSINDIRKAEDMSVLGDWADKYLVPSNYADAETGEPFARGGTPMGETRVNEKPASTDDDPTFNDSDRDGNIEEMKAFAIAQMTELQKLEIKALDEGFNKQCGFAKHAEKFYRSYGDKITSRLSALTNIDGFIDDLEPTITAFVSESQQLVADVTNHSDWLPIVSSMANRAKTLVEELTCSK